VQADWQRTHSRVAVVSGESGFVHAVSATEAANAQAAGLKIGQSLSPKLLTGPIASRTFRHDRALLKKGKSFIVVDQARRVFAGWLPGWCGGRLARAVPTANAVLASGRFIHLQLGKCKLRSSISCGIWGYFFSVNNFLSSINSL
jgi:hypothetical protein